MSGLADNYRKAKASIREAEIATGLAPGSVNLLVVSKRRSSDQVRELFGLGQQHFAESFWQEATEKMQALQSLAITWHFIGRIQSRKLKAIAQHFSWVHSLCRESDVDELDEQRAKSGLPPLLVCVQVNVSSDPNKAGVLCQQVEEFCRYVQQKPALHLRGLMTILAKDLSASEIEEAYGQLQALQQQLKAQGLPLDVLSMGMSNDYPVAIRQGATWVRLGRVLFE